MKKLILVMTAFVILQGLSHSVHADPFAFVLKGGFELQGGGSFGFAPQEAIFRRSSDTSRNYALNAFLRVRRDKLMIGFEGVLVLPHGVAAGPFFDLWRSDHVRVHADALLYNKIWSNLSATSTLRSVDLVLGTGTELKVGKFIFIADCRFFIPNPRMAVAYGDFYRPVLKEAGRGVQLSFGVAIPLDELWPFNKLRSYLPAAKKNE